MSENLFPHQSLVPCYPRHITIFIFKSIKSRSHDFRGVSFYCINNGLIFLGPQEENVTFIFQIVTVNFDACSTFSQEIHDFSSIVLAPVRIRNKQSMNPELLNHYCDPLNLIYSVETYRLYTTPHCWGLFFPRATATFICRVGEV